MEKIDDVNIVDRPTEQKLIVNLWTWAQRAMFAILIAIVSWYAATVNSLQEGRIRNADRIEALQHEISEFKALASSRSAGHDAMDQKMGQTLIELTNDLSILKGKVEYNYSQVGVFKSLAEKVPELDSHLEILQHQAGDLLAFKREIEQTGSPILRAAIQDLSETDKRVQATQDELKASRLEIERLRSEIKALANVLTDYLVGRNRVPPGIRPQ